MKISHHPYTIMLLAALPLSLARKQWQDDFEYFPDLPVVSIPSPVRLPPAPPAPTPFHDIELLNPDKFKELFQEPTCKTYTMAYPSPNNHPYTTPEVESTPINWGMHALQWKGYKHMNDVDFPGGMFDPALAQSLNPPARDSGGSPDTHNSVSCKGASELNDLELASTGIFTTNTNLATDPRGGWTCAVDLDRSSAAVMAAMSIYYWTTPSYIDMHVVRTYDDTVPMTDDDKHYYDYGCENTGERAAYCASKGKQYCRDEPPSSSGDPCLRNLCKPDSLSDISPFCQLGAVAIKEVRLCIEGDEAPHVKCNWGDNRPSGWNNPDVNAGSCEASHMTLKYVVIGSFYDKGEHDQSDAPNYSERDALSQQQKLTGAQWDEFYGNVNGASPELVFDPPPGTDIAALQEKVQRTTKNFLDSSALDKMFERRMNSKAGTIRGKDEGNN